MKDTKFRILLDIHEVRSQATIPVKVGDVSCKIYITLVEGGKPYKIHENSFGVFTGKKGDDKYLFNNCVIENGIIRYDFTPQTVAAAGVLECEIRIYDEDGGVLTTPSFNIVVDERAVNDSELASTTEFTFLDEIIVNEGQRMENERNRIEAFNNMGLSVEDKGDYYILTKTNKDGSKEEFPIGKGEDYEITPEDYQAIADKVVKDNLDSQAEEYFENLDARATEFLEDVKNQNKDYIDEATKFTSSASGSAITIESANAPLQNLKLFGKTTQNGTPTPTEPKELKSVGDSGSFRTEINNKNLIDTSSIATQTNKGVTFTNNGNGSITVNGTATENASLSLVTLINFNGGDYLLSGGKGSENVNLYASYYDENFSWLSESWSTSGEHPLHNKKYGITIISVFVKKGATCNNVTIYPMLRHKSYDNTFEKGKKQVLTMPYTLRSANGITDEIDFTRGVHIQRAKEFSLRIADMNNSETFAGWTVVSGVTECINAGSSNIIDALTNVGTKIGYNTMNGQMQLFFQKSVYGLTQTEWKTKYPDLVVKIILPLITPIETPLSEIELNAYRQLMTNSGNTTILSEADMTLDYYTPKGQPLGNIHTQINKDYLKLQQAIIETGGN